jgi:hypothetical protein
MSGSKSSARDAVSGPEALSFTVHNVDAPEVDGDVQRRRSGRLKMFAVLAVCAAPVIASYLTYFVLRPEGRSNYGTLVSPARPLPDLNLQRLDGGEVPARSLKGQWLLVVVGPSGCDAGCERRLFAQRQLREMLGRDRDRVDKVWLVTDEGPLTPALRAAVEAAPAPATVLRMSAADLGRWLTPEAGHRVEEHLYIVDPMGDWMMRMPVNFEPSKVKRDLERLVRASAGWDKPGR